MGHVTAQHFEEHTAALNRFADVMQNPLPVPVSTSVHNVDASKPTDTDRARAMLADNEDLRGVPLRKLQATTGISKTIWERVKKEV